MTLFVLFVSTFIFLGTVVSFIVRNNELTKWERRLYGLEDVNECEVVEYTTRDAQD